MATLSLAAVGGLDGEGGVTLAANHLFTLVSTCKSGEGSLDFDGTETHTATETEHQVEGGLLLDVVVGESSAVFKLLACEDEALLVWGDTFLVLDLGLDVLNGVTGLNIEGDGLAGQSLDEDLHATTQTEDQVKGGLLLDVVVGEGSAVFELLASEDKSLLIWGDTFLVLDLCLDVLNGVTGLNIEGDGLAGQSLDEDLHATMEAEGQVKCGFLLDVVGGEGSAAFELLASEDKSLLIWGDTFHVFDLGLDVFNGVAGLDIKDNGFS